MAIGSLPRFQRIGSIAFILLAFGGFVFRGMADEIKLNTGSTITGVITGVLDGRVGIDSRSSNGGLAHQTLYLIDIQSVTMDPPTAMAGLKDAAPATVIATLEPLVKQYAGLPTYWVVDAMSQLADAYDTMGEASRASALYAQIDQLYPHSPYQNEAVTGEAKLDVEQGKIDDALALVKPLIDKANQNLAPSQEEGRVYARAFLVYGQVLQARKQDAQALEAYLTVKTMFYQNPRLVEEAQQLAESLRKQDPAVSVD